MKRRIIYKWSRRQKNAKESKHGISVIKKHEDLLKGTNGKIINMVGKQGELLEIFKDSDMFFDSAGLSLFNIYFKIDLHKILCNYPKLKSLTLTASYLRVILNGLKKFVRQMNTYLVRKSKNISSFIFYIFYPCLANFV